MASLALHATAVLPLKEVDDETVVPLLVDLPLLLTRDLGRERVELGLSGGRHGDWVGSDEHAVEVFVQTVQQEGKELLRVVLVHTVEGRGKLDDGFLQSTTSGTRDVRTAAAPSRWAENGQTLKDKG